MTGFRWNEWNTEHIARHGVTPDEAEKVVRNARRPYPSRRGDSKRLVWGRGLGDRFVQVIYIEDPDGTIFVIHARPLTDQEKRQYRRSHRHEG
jgi:uncharacterized DUF497 family protein